MFWINLPIFKTGPLRCSELSVHHCHHVIVSLQTLAVIGPCWLFKALSLLFSPPGGAAAAPVDSAGSSLVIQATLQALKSVVTSPMSRQEKSREAWKLLLRSALSSLLELWNVGT